MNNTLFEQFGGTQIKQGDYLLPNLILPAEEETDYIGVWGQRRLNYLKHHRKVLYYNLLTSGKLHSHLADTEEQAQQLFSRLVKQLAEAGWDAFPRITAGAKFLPGKTADKEIARDNIVVLNATVQRQTVHLARIVADKRHIVL